MKSMGIEITARERKSHIWDRHPDDYYIEPEWVSQRLFAVETFHGMIYDPACGSGRILASARDAGLVGILGADVVARSEFCSMQVDFLSEHCVPVENIVSNPPFKHAKAFVEKALIVSRRKVAMLLPATWMLGDARSRWLATTPLRKVLFITPRPAMPPGTVIEAGVEPGGGKQDFAWYIWLQGYEGPVEAGWLRRVA